MPETPSPETLVSLLTDEAPSTRAAVRRALVELGPRAIPALRRASDGNDAPLRARARQVLLEMRRARGEARLRSLLAEDTVPLEDGLLAIDEWIGAADPALDVPGQLAAWADSLRGDVGPDADVERLAAAIRALLGSEVGFDGAEVDFHNVDHVSLTRCIESARGLPLTLSAVYALVARRAGYIAALLPFPGHVLLHLGAGGARRILDPFTGGDAVDESTCQARLHAMGAPPGGRWLEPASDRSMIVRQVRNLGASMARHGRHRDAGDLAALVDELESR
ncbi:MAG: transglutaminase family protein [Planctomycetota bacterium]